MRVALLLVGLGLVGIGLYVAIRLPTLRGISGLRWRNIEFYSTSIGIALVVVGVAGVALATFLPEPSSPESKSAEPQLTVTAVHTARVTVEPSETDPTEPTPAASPPPDPTPTPTPKATPVAVPTQQPAGPAEGTQLSSYTIDLPSGYVIRRFSGQRARPVQSSTFGFDLWWSGLTSTFRSTGQLSLLDKANPSYRDCNENTQFRDFVVAGDEGQTLCFSGHGVVAAITIKEPVIDPASFVSLDVVVWQGS